MSSLPHAARPRAVMNSRLVLLIIGVVRAYAVEVASSFAMVQKTKYRPGAQTLRHIPQRGSLAAGDAGNERSHNCVEPVRVVAGYGVTGRRNRGELGAVNCSRHPLSTRCVQEIALGPADE